MHWQYFGEVRPDVLVEAWLADGTEVPVVRLGWLWIVEYPDRYGQALFVRLGDDVEEYRDWLTPRVLGDD